MINTPLNCLEYVIFDIETTGLDNSKEQIIEIGAVKINGKGEIIDRFQKFINLYKYDDVPEIIVNLTGIDTTLLLEKGEDEKTVMNEFLKFIKDKPLIAQNAKFDMGFLDRYYLNNNIFLDNIVIDTIDLGKTLFPDKYKYNLKVLAEYFEIEYDGNSHHRADYDAELTAQIFIKGMKMLVDKNNGNIESLIQYEEVLKLTEASQKQKKYLYHCLIKNDITVENKCFLTKVNASRQIDLLK